MRIAILDDYQGVSLSLADWAQLPEGTDIVPFTDHVADEDGLAARLAEFDVVCRMRERTPMPASLLERLPRLKLIAATGARNPDIDLARARELGIAVCQTSSFGLSTVEIAWWLILSLFRRAPQERDRLRSGAWQGHLGHTVQGKSLGVIGLGKLGTPVARIALAFGMKVLAWSPNLTSERAAAEGAVAVPLQQLLREADAITIHMPLSERSRGLLGAPELALMKRGAFLVNTSRGPIVDEPALLAALQEGRIGGLGLDVFDVEPLPPDHPFRYLPNVVATPHIGYVTEETYRLYFQETLENIQAFLSGRPLRLIN